MIESGRCGLLICQVVPESAVNEREPSEGALKDHTLVGVTKEDNEVTWQQLCLIDAEADRTAPEPCASRASCEHERSSYWQRCDDGRPQTLDCEALRPRELRPPAG